MRKLIVLLSLFNLLPTTVYSSQSRYVKQRFIDINTRGLETIQQQLSDPCCSHPDLQAHLETLKKIHEKLIEAAKKIEPKLFSWEEMAQRDLFDMKIENLSQSYTAEITRINSALSPRLLKQASKIHDLILISYSAQTMGNDVIISS